MVEIHVVLIAIAVLIWCKIFRDIAKKLKSVEPEDPGKISEFYSFRGQEVFPIYGDNGGLSAGCVRYRYSPDRTQIRAEVSGGPWIHSLDDRYETKWKVGPWVKVGPETTNIPMPE
jgi:hypothetical protein